MSAQASTKAIVVSRWVGPLDQRIVLESIKNRLRKESHAVKNHYGGYKVRFSKQASFDLEANGRMTATWPFAVE